MLKRRFGSSVSHSCNVKTQICITRPQCVNTWELQKLMFSEQVTLHTNPHTTYSLQLFICSISFPQSLDSTLVCLTSVKIGLHLAQNCWCTLLARCTQDAGLAQSLLWLRYGLLRRREIFSSIGLSCSTGRRWGFTEILAQFAVWSCRSVCSPFSISLLQNFCTLYIQVFRVFLWVSSLMFYITMIICGNPPILTTRPYHFIVLIPPSVPEE